MDWTTPPLEPTPTTAPVVVRVEAPERAAAPANAGISVRRLVMTAGLAGLLLVAGGVAAVSAASPGPSTAPSTTAPSTTAPSTTSPSGRTGHDCPNMGGSSNGSGGSNTAPASPAPTPAT